MGECDKRYPACLEFLSFHSGIIIKFIRESKNISVGQVPLDFKKSQKKIEILENFDTLIKKVKLYIC